MHLSLLVARTPAEDLDLSAVQQRAVYVHLLQQSKSTQLILCAEQLKPAVEELMLFASGDAYRVVSKCDLELELTHANKGVEGIQYYDAGDRGELPLLDHCPIVWSCV